MLNARVVAVPTAETEIAVSGAQEADAADWDRYVLSHAEGRDTGNSL